MMTITSQPSFLSKRKKKGGEKGKLLYTVFSNYSCLNLSEISEISWQKVNSFSITGNLFDGILVKGNRLVSFSKHQF